MPSTVLIRRAEPAAPLAAVRELMDGCGWRDLVEPGTLWHSIASFELGMTTMAKGDLIRAEKDLLLPRSDGEQPFASMTPVIAAPMALSYVYSRRHS